jgi:DNA-binding transcriptional regulator LsrR (DeoR family)
MGKKPPARRRGKKAPETPSTADDSRREVPEVELLEAYEKIYFGKKPKGMQGIAEGLGLTLAQFRNRLRGAYANNSIIIVPPENRKRMEQLSEKFPGIEHHVLVAQGDHFFSSAAHVFFEELNHILEERPKSVKREPLRIGVVSGRTSGGMVEAICSVRSNWWSSYLRTDLLPPEIFIYALNVSQTDGYDQLKGNANILAYQLAHRFLLETKQKKVEAYGLSATLLQTREQAQSSDCKKETSVILRQTDPVRLKKSLASQGEKDTSLPEKSQLDLVITGVGSIDSSLFRDYSKAYSLDIDHLKEQRVAGDIAYCPLDRAGNLQDLLDKDKQKWEFYRAISLDVLQEISANPAKRVIVVARNFGENTKTDIIHAVIYKHKKHGPYCNVLITDDGTAEELVIKFG